MNQQELNEVVEGYLPPGSHPTPGARPPREVWTGEEHADASAVENGPWTSQTPVVTAPPRNTSASVRSGAATRNVATSDGRRTKRRIMGIDAARGFALLGMVAVHTLPSTANDAGDPTLTWTFFGGHAAALFAVLAGVSLAFLTGGRTPRKGRAATRARVSLVVRALLLLILGLTLNLMDIPAYNILVYYGMMFLLAIPFTALSVRWLLVSSVLFAVVAPFVMQWSLTVLPAHEIANPNFVDLFASPGTVFAELFLTGTYPAIPWMAFICLGMALGRLPLTRDRIQILLVIIGALLAAVAHGITLWLLYRTYLEESLLAATPWLSGDDVWSIQAYGPDPQLPTTTLKWLLLSGPHTNTPFALAESAGLAMVALGFFLIVCRFIGRWLTPLAAMGSMTLTLYTSHLIFLSLVPISSTPWFWYLIQMAVAALLATAWQQAVGNGPLERMVTRISRGVGNFLVRDKPRGARRA